MFRRIALAAVVGSALVGALPSVAHALEAPPAGSFNYTLVRAQHSASVPINRSVALSLTPDGRVIAGDGCLEFGGTWANSPTLVVKPVLTNWCSSIDSLSNVMGRVMTDPNLRTDFDGTYVRLSSGRNSLLFRAGAAPVMNFGAAAPIQPAVAEPGANGCLPNYSGTCVPGSRTDMDCPEVFELTGKTNFAVSGPDVYGLDGDNDGVACETTNWSGYSSGGASYSVVAPAQVASPTSNGCDRNYLRPCIPIVSGNRFNCRDIGTRVYLAPGSTDPHNLDGGAGTPGVGCEGYPEPR